MEKNTKKRMYPKSVLTLYLKLYCKRRNSLNKNKMVEGIKSWLTLSKMEKQQFYNKYRDLQYSHKNKLAEYLRKTQPFMKKRKNLHRTPEELKTSGHNETSDYNNETGSVSAEIVKSPQEYDAQSDHDNIMTNDAEHVTTCINETQNDDTAICYMEPVLAEPTPPSIRTARELFDMLNATNGVNNETWTSISNTQKSRYRRAVQVLKNEYLTKYKAYLESLSCKQLFNYYNNFLFD